MDNNWIDISKYGYGYSSMLDIVNFSKMRYCTYNGVGGSLFRVVAESSNTWEWYWTHPICKKKYPLKKEISETLEKAYKEWKGEEKMNDEQKYCVRCKKPARENGTVNFCSIGCWKINAAIAYTTANCIQHKNDVEKQLTEQFNVNSYVNDIPDYNPKPFFFQNDWVDNMENL